MKYFSIFFIFIFLLIVSVLGAPAESESSESDITKLRPCVFQMTYFDGCNWNTCGRANNIFGSIVNCGSSIPKIDPPADFWVDDEYLKPGRKCVVGASHFDGCQLCFCALESVPKCVRAICEECRHRRKPPPETFWQK